MCLGNGGQTCLTRRESSYNRAPRKGKYRSILVCTHCFLEFWQGFSRVLVVLGYRKSFRVACSGIKNTVSRIDLSSACLLLLEHIFWKGERRESMGGEENGEERRKTSMVSSANPFAPGKQLKSASALNPKQTFLSQWTFGGNIKKIFFTSACLLPQIHSGRSLLELKTYKIRGPKHKPVVSSMAQILTQTRAFLFCPTQDQDSCWKKLITLFQSTFLQQHRQSSEVLNSSTKPESQWELCSLHPGTVPVASAE